MQFSYCDPISMAFYLQVFFLNFVFKLFNVRLRQIPKTKKNGILFWIQTTIKWLYSWSINLRLPCAIVSQFTALALNMMFIVWSVTWAFKTKRNWNHFIVLIGIQPYITLRPKSFRWKFFDINMSIIFFYSIFYVRLPFNGAIDELSNLHLALSTF